MRHDVSLVCASVLGKTLQRRSTGETLRLGVENQVPLGYLVTTVIGFVGFIWLLELLELLESIVFIGLPQLLAFAGFVRFVRLEKGISTIECVYRPATLS